MGVWRLEVDLITFDRFAENYSCKWSHFNHHVDTNCVAGWYWITTDWTKVTPKHKYHPHMCCRFYLYSSSCQLCFYEEGIRRSWRGLFFLTYIKIRIGYQIGNIRFECHLIILFLIDFVERIGSRYCSFKSDLRASIDLN